MVNKFLSVSGSSVNVSDIPDLQDQLDKKIENPIIGTLVAPQVNTNLVFEPSLGSSINLNNTDIAITSTNLRFNGNDVVTDNGTLVKNDQDNDFNNNTITGVNVLYVQRTPSEAVDGAIAPWGVPRKAYVDSHLRIVYNDKDNTFNNNILYNLRKVQVNEDPTSDNDLVRRSYLDSKHRVQLGGEFKGTLTVNEIWKIGANASDNTAYGIPLMSSGRILRRAYSSAVAGNTIGVDVILNGTNIVDNFTKANGSTAGLFDYNPPIEFNSIDYLLCRISSFTGTASTAFAVSFLIEYDS